MSKRNQNALTPSRPFKEKCIFYILPYFTLVILHVILTIKMQYPNIWDEFGYLGRARYLAGVAHLPHDISRYHFGYSLFLLPSFWLFSDPYYVYKSVLITNSFLISALFFPLFYILHTLLGNDKKFSAAISMVCCLYPAFLLQSNLAWSENIFIPVYAFFIASFAAFLKNKSYTALLLYSFLCGFLYTIHPRAMPILLIVVFYMCILMLLNQVTRTHFFLFCCLVICIYFVTNSVNDDLIALDGGEKTNQIIIDYLILLLSPSKLALMLIESLGQALYLILATYGLSFIGLLYACTILLDEWRRNHICSFSNAKFNFFLLLFLSSAGIFFVSNLQVSGGHRADHLIYGRYNEGFLSLYLMLGLWSFCCQDSQRNLLRAGPYLVSFIIFILMLIVVIGNGFNFFSTMADITNVNIVNILGIYPLIGFLRKLDIIFISLAYIPFVFLLMLVFKWKFKVGLSLLCLYFIAVSICGYTVFYVRASYIRQITTLASRINSLEGVREVSYDEAFKHGETWPAYQYLLPSVEFKEFNSKKNELPASRLVISGRSWKDRKNLRSKLIARENSVVEIPGIINWIIAIFFEKPLPPRYHIDQCLWLLPEEYSPFKPITMK